MEEIRSALACNSVVSLVGPHGVGKSELALHVLATTDGDEHVFVDLLSARDRDDIVAALAAALDVRVCDDPIAAIRSALIARGGMIVLDRCHHLDSTAEVVRALRVDGRPPIVCTSTRPLGIVDERVIAIDPLDPFAGAELYSARTAHPPESPREHSAVRDLVTLCGGIPLAIELCAAWPESPLQLLRQLELRVGRDRELRDIVFYSIERLDSVSRAALSRASLIEGTFTFAAFEAIAELPSDVAPLSILSDLAERGLVARAPRAESGFIILPIVRTIAESLLDDADRLRTMQRHARFFATHYPADVVALSRERADLLAAYQAALVDPELTNVAVVIARALGPVLRRHGPLELARGVVEATLAIADDSLLRVERFALDESVALDSQRHPRGALLAGEALLDRDRPAAALPLLRHAATEQELAVLALRGAAEALRRLEQLDEAQQIAERALFLARRRDRPTEVGDVLTLRGSIALDRDELRAARADLVEALTILGEGRDERAAAAAMLTLADVQAEEGTDPTTTLDCAADLARRAGDLCALERVEILRAVHALTDGDLDRARACLDAAGPRPPLAVALREVVRARGDDRGFSPSSPLGIVHLERARARLALVRGEPAPPVQEPKTSRLSRRTLLAAKRAIARDGSRARFPGVDLDLDRRATLKNVVAAFLRTRVEEPGRAVTTAELFAAGWPKERVPPAVQADRVHAALQALRDLGMRGQIVTLPGGWALDPGRTYDVLPT